MNINLISNICSNNPQPFSNDLNDTFFKICTVFLPCACFVFLTNPEWMVKNKEQLDVFAINLDAKNAVCHYNRKRCHLN